MVARAAVCINVGQSSLADGSYATKINRASAPDFATLTADLATVTADVAVLVADGATPTQGHVNTLNTDLAVVNADYAALVAGIFAEVTVVWQNITHRNQMRAALLTVMRAIEGGYGGLAE